MKNALEVTNLKKTYKNGAHALKGVSLTVAEGDFFALLGPNGAGKSTLIGIVSGLVNKTEGEVSVFGSNIDRETITARSLIGLVPQEFNFNIFDKVWDIVVTQAGYYGVPREEAMRNAESILKQLGLWDKRNDQAIKLSGGMKRRLMIARGLVHNPRLLILDEPTAGVDIELRRGMWDFLIDLNKKGTTIILTTHYLEEAEQLCRHVAIINQGEIVESGAMKQVLGKLHVETLVLDLSKDISEEILSKLSFFDSKAVDHNTIEVSISPERTLNQAVRVLDESGIVVRSMRNKTNRLEELFVRLTTQPK